MLPQCAPILTAILKDEFSFSIIDCNGFDYSEDELAGKLALLNPDVVLTTGMSHEYHEQMHRVMAISKDVKRDVVTIAGGVYPTVLSDICLSDPDVDYIFMGHAEERLVPFLKLILEKRMEDIKRFDGIGYTNGFQIINPVTSFITTLKKTVKPDYSMLDLSPYLIQNTTDFQFNSDKNSASLITSFGCPYNCVFCASRTIGGRGITFREVEDVIAEIDYLRETYDIKRIVFLDDSFLASRKRAVRLLQAIGERYNDLRWNAATVSVWHLDDELLEIMKKSGCFQLTLAIESGSQRVLEEIIRKPLKLDTVEPVVKKCKELGIDVAGSFVIGFPGETWEEIRMTFAFADAIDLDLAHFHMATPLPMTDLYNLAKDRGLLPADFSFMNQKYFGFAEPFIETDEFSKFELKVLRAFEWDRINFKTPEKRSKVAGMYNMTIEELDEFRKNTRRRLGIYCDRIKE
jgi:radical SAM superfamily enzyme YgiQ (UPF0313 family)